jgi:hypothetical protein
MKKIQSSVSILGFEGRHVSHVSQKESLDVRSEDEEGLGSGVHTVHAFAGVQSAFTADMYLSEWFVWFFVAVALFFAVLWSREKLENMQSYYHVRRLYGLASLGFVAVLVTIFTGKVSLLVPVGMGTLAIVIAGIVDVIRPALISAQQRLLHSIQAIIVTLLAELLMAFALGWERSLLPLSTLILALMIRYVVYKNTLTSKSKHYSSSHFFSRV